jgi:hypothetical protein
MSLSEEETNVLKSVYVSEEKVSSKHEEKVSSKHAVRQSIPFTSTHMCETGFSNHAATKSKYRNRPIEGLDLRILLSNIRPNVKRTCDERIKPTLSTENCKYAVYKVLRFIFRKHEMRFLFLNINNYIVC